MSELHWGELYDPSHGINRPQTVFSLVFLRLFSVPPMAIQYFRRPPSFDNDSHEMNNRNPRFHRDRDVPDDDGDDALRLARFDVCLMIWQQKASVEERFSNRRSMAV